MAGRWSVKYFLLLIPQYFGQVQQKNKNEIGSYKVLCFSSKRNKVEELFMRRPVFQEMAWFLNDLIQIKLTGNIPKCDNLKNSFVFLYQFFNFALKPKRAANKIRMF